MGKSRRGNLEVEEKQRSIWLENENIQSKSIVCIIAFLILGMVTVCTGEMKWSKAQVVIDAVCIVAVLSLLILYVFRNVRIEVFAFLCIIFLGVM